MNNLNQVCLTKKPVTPQFGERLPQRCGFRSTKYGTFLYSKGLARILFQLARTLKFVHMDNFNLDRRTPCIDPLQVAFNSYMDLNAKITDEQYNHRPEVKAELMGRLQHFFNTCELMEMHPVKTLLMKMDEHRTETLSKRKLALAS